MLAARLPIGLVTLRIRDCGLSAVELDKMEHAEAPLVPNSDRDGPKAFTRCFQASVSHLCLDPRFTSLKHIELQADEPIELEFHLRGWTTVVETTTTLILTRVTDFVIDGL